jgi:hypothetical protein
MAKIINQKYKIMNDKKELILFYGRCNPPTQAHVMVWRKVIHTAQERKCDYRLYITHSHLESKKKNPLPPKIKKAWCETIAPDIVFTLTGGKIKTFIDVLNKAFTDGYTHITIIAGDDRNSLENLAKKYSEKPENISFESAGARFGDVIIPTDTIKSISGTKLREAIYGLNERYALRVMPDQLIHREKLRLYFGVLVGAGILPKITKEMKERCK